MDSGFFHIKLCFSFTPGESLAMNCPWGGASDLKEKDLGISSYTFLNPQDGEVHLPD